jgi:adenylyltransferase and sulfurtransferase
MSADLRRRIAAAEAELQSLRDQLQQAQQEEQEAADADADADADASQTAQSTAPSPPDYSWPLAPDDYDRYARQLILPGVGVDGQLRLKRASVLIVGAGGLGCPAALYLAGAGVGHLTLVDGDTVETSNLHRQIGHTAARVGEYKVDSLAAAMKARNPGVKYTVHREHLTVDNVQSFLGSGEHSADEKKSERSEDKTGIDLVLDCTDHPAIRYLISDACVRAGIPLVSAAALRTDGQLTVLNWPVGAGPCYRCVFPRPPPAASQTSCAEGGVLGPVVGVMGVLQALEAIRVLASVSVPAPDPPPAPTLTLFSAGGSGGLAPPSFRTVRLKGRRADCFACSADAPLKKLACLADVKRSASGWPDYVQFCGSSTVITQCILEPDERVSVGEFQRAHEQQHGTKEQRRHWLLDVREKEFYNMGTIAGAINIPFSKTQAGTAAAQEGLPPWLPEGIADDTAPIYLVCRVGNDSQVVTRQLKTLGLDRNGTRFVGDVAGGLLAWKRHVDSTMPFV